MLIFSQLACLLLMLKYSFLYDDDVLLHSAPFIYLFRLKLLCVSRSLSQLDG